MDFAIGRHLAETVDEHLTLVIAAAAVVLVILWPKISQRIEACARRR